MKQTMPATCFGKHEIRWGEKTYVMGICNLSPDSFSGDGIGPDVDAAVAPAVRLGAERADIIDGGGESTRPGTKPSDDIQQELDLVLPAIRAISAAVSVPVSIDSYKSGVAMEALKAGASIVNDIWGLKYDPRLANVAADAGAPIIHMANERDAPPKAGILAKVMADLEYGIRTAEAAGIPPENIIVDPGCGFGKTLEQNLELVNRLGELKRFNKPILLGTSRKSMIGNVLDLPPEDRLEGNLAITAIGIANGADIVRVHDVKETVRVCRMSDAIVRRGSVDD